MKKFILIMSMISSLSVLAVSHETDLLTSSQETQILKVIQNTCGDSWCGGDYAFKFDELKCYSLIPVCILRFRVQSRDDSSKTASLSCYPEGINSYLDIVNERFRELNWNFYESVTNCMFRHGL